MKQRSGIGGVAASPPAASQIPGKYQSFLVARGPGKPSLVLDEIERLPRGKGSEGAFASSVRSEQRTTAFSGTERAHTRNLL